MESGISRKAVVYGKKTCPNCDRAKMLLKNNDYEIEYVQLDDDNARQAFYERMTRELGGPVMSVPQVFVDDKYIGGYNEVTKFINDNRKVEDITFSKDF